MRENASERTTRYVETTSAALKRMRLKKPPEQISENTIQYVVDLARGYVKDSKHYKGKGKPVTSLACVAYAEGLLDAMKYLELVDF